MDPLPYRSPGRDPEPYRPEPARDPGPRRGVAAPVDPLPARSREPLPRRGAAAPVDPLPPRAPAGAVDPRSRRPLRGAAAEAARRGRPPAGTGYDTGYPPAGREPATGSGWPAAAGGAEAAPAWDDDPWPTTGGVAAAGGVYGRSADPRSGPAPVGYDAPPWAPSGSGTLADESAAWAGGPGPRPLAGDDDYGDDTYYDEDDDGGADDLHRRRGCRAVLMVLAVLVVVAAVAGWFGWSWVQRQIDPPGRPGKEVLVEIPDGTSTAGMGKVLADADVISDARVWSWYTKLRDVGSFQAGTYKLRENSSFTEAIDDLAADPLPPNSRLVQVPPGFTVDETVARLADPAKGVPGFTAEAVRAAMADPASRSAYLPADQPSLEGTLYPETYAVAEGDTPAVVIQRIVGQFDQVMNQLDANGRAPALNMTPYQAVIVASLV
ncbi:MAG TPA: endolytic transglycosylase MltG, partial [Acidimicrobiales bacterium]